MARYYDIDKLKEMIEAKADTLIEGKEAFLYVAKWLDLLPPADVVPKSEVDNWYQLYHSIKEELKQEKMYHRETDKLCDRYYIESQHAKRQVAREIFEEIEKAHDECIGVDITTRIGYFQQTKFEHKLAELKKKYTEGEE